MRQLLSSKLLAVILASLLLNALVHVASAICVCMRSWRHARRQGLYEVLNILPPKKLRSLPADSGRWRSA